VSSSTPTTNTSSCSASNTRGEKTEEIANSSTNQPILRYKSKGNSMG
jgi:hypothetical protein